MDTRAARNGSAVHPAFCDPAFDVDFVLVDFGCGIRRRGLQFEQGSTCKSPAFSGIRIDI